MMDDVALIVGGMSSVLVLLLGLAVALTVADWILDQIWRSVDGR